MINIKRKIKNTDCNDFDLKTLSLYTIIFFALTISYVFNNTGIRIGVILLAAVILIFSEVNRSFSLIAYLTAFTPIFKISLSSTSFVSYFMLIFLMKLIFLRNFKLKVSSLITYIGFLVYSILVTISVGIGIDYIQFQISLLLLLVVSSNLENFNNYRQINFAYVFGVINSVFSAIILYRIPNMQVLWKDAYINNVRRFSGLEYDPNFFSVILLITLSICIMFVLKEKSFFYKLSSLILVIIGFSTLSKTFLFGLVLLLIVTLYYTNSPIKLLGYLKKIVLLIPIILILLMLNDTFKDNVSLMFYRVSNINTLDDLTTNRYGMQVTYISFITSSAMNFLFGHGFSTEAIFQQGISYSAHNTYLQIIFYVGIVGFILITSYFVSIFKLKTYRKNKFSNLTLIIILIIMLSLDLSFKEFIPTVLSINLINRYYS
ncbi:hypothetical protein QBE52_02775 [Clostridiaceae bacterium 35-E11]